MTQVQLQRGGRGPLQRWAEFELGVGTPIVVALVTIAWFNDRQSMGRLLLMICSWIVVFCLVFGRRLWRLHRG